MPRRAEIQPRPVISDPIYDSQLVTQLMNRVMLDGKKSVAEKVVYGALEKVGERTGRPPVEVLEQAVKTVTPVLEVRSRRVGGANYQVPVEVPQRRGFPSEGCRHHDASAPLRWTRSKTVMSASRC